MKRILQSAVVPALLLFAAIGALFYPASSFSLLNFDDPVFITHNPALFHGFSWDAIQRAFTGLHGDESMYVPLLWVSYLLDLKFFGASPMNPWGFHLTNVLVHAFNSVLFYLLLLGLCRKPWRAFFFAALWALHPLRVESVAWVTERKDVLSGFFALLCLNAYLGAWTWKAGAQPHRSRSCAPLYGAAFLFFALGLLVKPMLVTLPFLMLLLDAWPLRRAEPTVPSVRRAAPRLLLEKWPFFLASAIASIAVYLTQTHSISSATLGARLYSIPSNYLFYLQKSFFPFHLFAMVPRTAIPVPAFLLATGILAAVTSWTWTRRRSHPNEGVGWLAFLGLLFPVAGIVLIGLYPVADRYSYLPAIGLSIALLWVLPSGMRPPGNHLLRIGRPVLALFILAALAFLTARQLPAWKNDQSLYAHIARQSPGHYAALHYQAREALFVNGDVVAADRLTDQLLQLKPGVSFGLVLKIICLSQLQSTEAALEFAQAHYPPADTFGNPGIYENYLTFLAFFARRYDLANRFMEESFRRCVFEPSTAEQLHALAMLLAHEQGAEADALAHAARITALRNKTRLAPEDFLPAYAALWASGLHVQTLPFFLRLVQACPDRPDILNNVAWLLATTPGSPADPQEVIRMARQALASSPDHPVILDTLAVAQANAGDFDGALQTAQQVEGILERSGTPNTPAMLQGVRQRIALYRTHQPYREKAVSRLLAAEFAQHQRIQP